MKKIDKLINSVLNGNYVDMNIFIDNKKVDTNLLVKYIATYFNVEKYYPEIENIKIDTKQFKKITKQFEQYKKNNVVGATLNDNLKHEIELCNSVEIHKELQKYMQNRLTNVDVIIFIKNYIDKKNLYIYTRYYHYTREECLNEIERLNLIFDILDKVSFKKNKMGILFKEIYFKPETYEYEFLGPSLYFDVYNISYYKRVYELIKKMIKDK